MPLRRRRGLRLPLRDAAVEPLGLVPPEPERAGAAGGDRVPRDHRQEGGCLACDSPWVAPYGVPPTSVTRYCRRRQHLTAGSPTATEGLNSLETIHMFGSVYSDSRCWPGPRCPPPRRPPRRRGRAHRRGAAARRGGAAGDPAALRIRLRGNGVRAGARPGASLRGGPRIVVRQGRGAVAAGRRPGAGPGPAGGDLSRDDDRPLYWARLGMTRELRVWKPGFGLPTADGRRLLGGWSGTRAGRTSSAIRRARGRAEAGSGHRVRPVHARP